jgi:tetratricopeptide (TPR) repeat protein
VTENDLAWISRSAQLLHSELGRTAERDSAIGEGFYRGGTISWLELDVGVDTPRELTVQVREAVERDLRNRDGRRISLHHYPGAGGTTVARRVAWDLHDEYPVLMVEQATDHRALADRIRRIHALTSNAILVVFEATLDTQVERLYSAIRADSIPCVFLIVERRAEAPAADTGERSFYLGALTAEERVLLVQAFGARVPERHPNLTRLAGSNARNVVPFLFGLTTYEADYVALEPYVERSVARLSEREQEAMKLISLVHHYAGLPLPSVLLAGVLKVPDGREVELADLVSADLLTLLVEAGLEYWRTAHDLIAHEALAQLLSPQDVAGARGQADWKVALSTLSAELITQAAREFGGLLPEDVRGVIDQLFIVRNNKAVFTGERELFSELMGDLPSNEGRIGVLQTLAECFPKEPHFWAHLGRLLSYSAKDHRRAIDAIDRAINIDDQDDTLYHMKGVILRNKMRTTAENREHLPPAELRERVLQDVDDARREFERSIGLNDESEYGHVALTQVCIAAIEFGRSQSDAADYSSYLAAPESGYYREQLALAEESLDRIREIRGGDRPSRYAAEIETEIQAFYDDYAALLQGWRSLLDRHDLAKPPIRRQLVRAYRRRAGSWRGASGDERARAMELLEANLRDDPADTRSLLEWLRVARFARVSLDRASELIQYSARNPATAPRDVLFYDYVISGLLALSGRDTAIVEYRRKIERCRERAASFGNRRFIYEWFTEGIGLGQLVHHSDLRDWERSAGGPDPALLRRRVGRVHKIARPQSGEIEFGPGLRAFFSPGAAQPSLVADRHTNARVSFLLGFSYDGPQAWSVQLLDS